MKKNDSIRMGFAGKLAEIFLDSKLTPVIIFVSLVVGFLAIIMTPKEEEPQINVPMIDIQLSAWGFSPEEMERKVTEVVERSVWGLDGVEYVYSSSRWHSSLITVRFKVGEETEPSLLKIHHKLMEVRNSLPSNVLQPSVTSYSIDDVPFLSISFSSDSTDDYRLRSMISPLARELSSTPDLSKLELLGGRKKTIRVIMDSVRMKSFGVDPIAVVSGLESQDSFLPAGKNWSESQVFDVDVGGRIRDAVTLKHLPVAQRGGRVVRLGDVTSVEEGPEERTKYLLLYDKQFGNTPKNAVTLSFAKRKGTNVVVLAEQILERAESFRQGLPEDVKMSVIRNYGSSAEDKSKELIEHLFIATISVSVLIAVWMGGRAAFVVAIAIPVTLALTLALYYFLGYSLNRVTLFALIFSIGILVDDAIVIVENVERRLKEDPLSSISSITLRAVAEVGNPTILATFTVIAAILPMAFVRGLMGPYMKPIPVGASLAMLISLIVAFIITPWASLRFLKRTEGEKNNPQHSRLDSIYILISNKLLFSGKNSLIFGVVSILLLFVSFGFLGFKWVKVKMLPFDNKEEFQILIDYPVDTPLSEGIAKSQALVRKLLANENVTKIQIFAGEPAPFSFSGMVKHSFLRNEEYKNDLHVVLKHKDDRKQSSHEIIESLRPVIVSFGKETKAVTKILEIPPGPPVMATLVAEVYANEPKEREIAARHVYGVFSQEESVVDLDSSYREGREKRVYPIDYFRAGFFGVKAFDFSHSGKFLFSESSILSLADVSEPEEISVVLSLSQEERSSKFPFRNISLNSMEAGSISADSVLGESYFAKDKVLFRKNLRPVSYVTAELSGKEEAPVYGMLKIGPKIQYETRTADVPWNLSAPVIKWDGEWFITYEVFRDLGSAFAVVMILIYVLVLGWFKSYSVPLVIMAPIPISLIGILPGHWLTGAYFTATSMIGFIAGAGIIVRNSILLVDFIEEEIAKGIPLKEAVIQAGVIRFRPMLLTASAVVVGSFVMLFDPIFQGLAVSLMFGEIAATLLSRFAVPVLYYWMIGVPGLKRERKV